MNRWDRKRLPYGRLSSGDIARTLTFLIVAAALGGCGGEPRHAENVQGDSAATPDTAADRDTSTRDVVATEPPEETGWGYPALAEGEVPAVYLEEWRKAENRDSCAPIAPATLGDGADARPRAATFGGGWGVAYDMPDLRSAFGVAGAGVTTSGDIFSGWTNRRDWPDGSFVEYGPEGGGGLNQVAYLRVQGQECLYNIWSRLSIDHLELLLDQLRRVRVPAG